jgi:cytochrome c-type biogenesis protein
MSATALTVAFGGGVISLLSPCVLPVVPAYLSITTGLSVSDADSDPQQRPRGPGLGTVIRGGGLFVVGFSVVFVVLGLSATAIGSLLLRNHVPLTRASGLAVIAMALALLASTAPVPGMLGRELRFHPQVGRYGAAAAPIAGAAFAFGWTPCIGPVLGSVLAVASDERQLAQGAALLAMYAAGLAVPFLIIALTFHRSLIALRFVRRHSVLLTRASATVLAGYGVLLAFDRLSWFTLQVQHGATALGVAWVLRLG